jgi:ABC-type lipoprotein release transport system permease subunit
MIFPLYISKRYFFAKKSTNAINIIAGISVLGVAVGTAALILVMSVFNGFEGLITGLLNYFNPDIKVVANEGKTFTVDSSEMYQIRSLEEVLFVSRSLEEVAFFEYKQNQRVGIIKGVDDQYSNVTGVDQAVREGDYRLSEEGKNYAILGAGLQYGLTVNINDFLSPLNVYMLKRKTAGTFDKPFKTRLVYPAGAFQIQQEFDNQYALAPLEFVRDLLEYEHEISALEIRLTSDANLDAVKQHIRDILGDRVLVKDRFEQEEAFLKIMRIEKWMGVAVLSLTLILVAFNIIGALWMLVLEKKKDIAILKSLGTNNRDIKRIFYSEGLMISGLGFIIGVLVALAFYYIHKQYGLIVLGSEYLVEAYPMELMFFDILIVALIVGIITFIASVLPAKRASLIPAFIKEE